MMARYPEGTAVLVRYPAPAMTRLTLHESWPWLPSVIEEECGPDEWLVCVTAQETRILLHGTPAPAGADDADVFYPCCFRDASELRTVAE
jgi:hypothetical protein